MRATEHVIEDKRQIIALGGGGFSMEPDNLLLDEYILAQSNKRRPNICFVGTASGDAKDYIDRFYGAFKKLNSKPAHLSLFHDTPPDWARLVMNQDIIYVGGGNTRNLLLLWKAWLLDQLLIEAWNSGIILAGISAGSICWFEEGITDSIPGKLTRLPCLGLLPGSNCPHYDGEAKRRPAYRKFIQSGEMKPGFAVQDSCALHLVGTQLFQAVSSRPLAKAYWVERGQTKITQRPLASTYLGS